MLLSWLLQSKQELESLALEPLVQRIERLACWALWEMLRVFKTDLDQTGNAFRLGIDLGRQNNATSLLCIPPSMSSTTSSIWLPRNLSQRDCTSSTRRTNPCPVDALLGLSACISAIWSHQIVPRIDLYSCASLVLHLVDVGIPAFAHVCTWDNSCALGEKGEASSDATAWLLADLLLLLPKCGRSDIPHRSCAIPKLLSLQLDIGSRRDALTDAF